MALISDDFTGTAGQLLTARPNWSARGPGTVRAAIGASNNLQNLTGGDETICGLLMDSKNHYIECVAGANFSNNLGGFPLCVRVSSRSDYLAARFETASGLWEIWRNGANRIANVAGSVTAGDVIRLQVGDDNTIRLFKNGTQILSGTDTDAKTALYAGVRPVGVLSDVMAGVVAGDIVAPAVLSSPTGASTGATTATVGATTNTAPSVGVPLAVQVLPAATAAPTAATIMTAPTQTITSGANGARTFSLTGLSANTAYRAHFAQGSDSNVVSTASFTTDAAAPIISSPTRSTPTATSAVVGFTTDTGSGEARAVLIAATNPPTAPSAAQVKAGQNAAGTTVGVVAPAALTITSAGVKTFASAAVTSGLTYYGFIVHTASGVDSAVLATGPMYPGTGRPAADVGAAGGWTASSGTDLFAMLDEDTPSDTDFITSPELTAPWQTKDFDLDKPYPAGTYANLRIRCRVPGATGLARVRLLDASGNSLAVSADHAVTGDWTTFTTATVTIAATATRFRVEGRSA